MSVTHPSREALGKISFVLTSGSKKVHQILQMPMSLVSEKYEWNNGGGREYFAKWEVDYQLMASDYFTDANGFDLIKREVFRKDSDSFSASFVPVDASISIGDYKKENMFTVWNDRPQAGSVHYDRSIKLLVQRGLRTDD